MPRRVGWSKFRPEDYLGAVCIGLEGEDGRAIGARNSYGECRSRRDLEAIQTCNLAKWLEASY